MPQRCTIRHKGGFKMSETKKRGRWPSTVSSELLQKVRELSDVTRIPLSKLVDEAFEDLLKKWQDQTPK